MLLWHSPLQSTYNEPSTASGAVKSKVRYTSGSNTPFGLHASETTALPTTIHKVRYEWSVGRKTFATELWASQICILQNVRYLMQSDKDASAQIKCYRVTDILNRWRVRNLVSGMWRKEFCVTSISQGTVLEFRGTEWRNMWYHSSSEKGTIRINSKLTRDGSLKLYSKLSLFLSVTLCVDSCRACIIIIIIIS
jgi:hypothetical protein